MRNHWPADIVVARSVSVATAGDINLRGAITSDQWRRKSKGIRSLGREWRLSPSPNVLPPKDSASNKNRAVYAIGISILYCEYYNIYYACLVNAKVRLGEPNLRAGSVLKIQATATIAYGGLLFPPERGEHGPPFPLAQVEAVSGYPAFD